MPANNATSPLRFGFRAWPWLVLFLAVVPAIWHVVDFPDDIDPEFPRVARPTMSRRPPPAYRLAEPGDTIDRVAIYFSSAAVMLSIAGCVLERKNLGLWPGMLALALAAYWYAATPGPTFDGWHGWGPRAILEPASPMVLKLLLIGGMCAVVVVVMASIAAYRGRFSSLLNLLRERRAFGLLLFAIVLVVLRQFEIPGVEPLGYWPRWSYTLGILAFDLALVGMLTGAPRPAFSRRALLATGGAAGWFALVVGGIWITWYHRPLNRLKTVESGKIYMSAMPTKEGLEVAQARHHFKTIINLFPENTRLRSPRLPDELKFAKDHGIRYIGNPARENEDDESSAFLDSTLKIAQDPDAWPILVHCHGCMDRTPAWMGIYRFVVQGRPLDEILTEIERHRGYRPKASVTLLYNRVLPALAPEHYRLDPTANLLKRCAEGISLPGTSMTGSSKGAPNSEAPARVGAKSVPHAHLPNLTAPRRSLEYHKTLRDPQTYESAISS